MSPPLAVYIHWPYCARICPYCDFNVVRDRGRRDEQAALADAIVRDLEAQAELTGERTLVSVFFGGGTPSLMDPDCAGRIVETARRLWPTQGPVEITLEANPTDAESGRFRAFADAGVQRLSLGVQSLHDDALRFLGRNHDSSDARRAVEAARLAFPRLSLDLIYARPGQTPQAWAAELTEALALGPEHISPYQLTIEAGTAFDRMVSRGRFTPPDGDTGAALYETTQAVLTAAGFDAYEVSNHAKSQSARSRHNLAYWRGEDYVGAGPGAHGRLTLEDVRTATTAPDRIGDYLALVSRAGVGFDLREPLSAVEAAQERLLMGLRMDEGVAFGELGPLDVTPESARVLDFVEAGLIADDPGRLRATDAGRAVLDRLTRELAG